MIGGGESALYHAKNRRLSKAKIRAASIDKHGAPMKTKTHIKAGPAQKKGVDLDEINFPQ